MSQTRAKKSSPREDSSSATRFAKFRQLFQPLQYHCEIYKYMGMVTLRTILNYNLRTDIHIMSLKRHLCITISILFDIV